MIDLRDMQILTALDKHRHFARAAEACGISQPAFSARIRNLEEELGQRIVHRGNRFQGFTAAGEITLHWGQKMLTDLDGLRQEIAASTGALSGRLTLGTVPTALAAAARIPALLAEAHPGLVLDIHSATSTEIRRGLENLTFAAGISYADGADKGVEEIHLYEESYLLAAPEAMIEGLSEIPWAEAAALPLCLLTPTMQNRQILERIFAGQGVRPNVVTETNVLTIAWLQLASGRAAAILPERLTLSQPPLPHTRFIPLTEPDISRPIALLLPKRTPAPPLHTVLRSALPQDLRTA